MGHYTCRRSCLPATGRFRATPSHTGNDHWVPVRLAGVPGLALFQPPAEEEQASGSANFLGGTCNGCGACGPQTTNPHNNDRSPTGYQKPLETRDERSSEMRGLQIFTHNPLQMLRWLRTVKRSRNPPSSPDLGSVPKTHPHLEPDVALGMACPAHQAGLPPVPDPGPKEHIVTHPRGWS
jgi:hypothetical protein